MESKEKAVLDSQAGEQSPRTSAERASTRTPRKRKGFGSRQAKLWVDPDSLDPNYHYYWFRDEPGRIEQALDVGYEFVTPDQIRTATGVEIRDTSLGKQVSVVAGTYENGSACHQILMRIPQELYQEYYEEEQEYNDRVDNAIKNGVVANADKPENFYVADGGISMKVKNHQ